MTLTSSSLSLLESIIDGVGTDTKDVQVVALTGFFRFLQAQHCQVVLELFGNLFKPRQERWKNFPVLQSGPSHSTSLSVGLGLDAQTQIMLHCNAAWLIAAFCACWLVDDERPLFLLNCGNLLQWGQYHVLGIIAELRARHDGWNPAYGHSVLLHVITVSSPGARQKQIPLSIGLLTGKVHLLVYHRPRISGRIYILQNASSFGTAVFQCLKSG